MYFVCTCCHRPATCHGSWRIKLHNFSDPCRVAWLGKGGLRAFLLFLHLTWEAATPQWRLRQDWGRRDAGLYMCHVRQRNKVGACEGRQLPFMKGLDLLSDLRPTESKCWYFSTYLAPPKDDPTLNSACLKTAMPGSLFTVSRWCLICTSQFKRITSLFPPLSPIYQSGKPNQGFESHSGLISGTFMRADAGSQIRVIPRWAGEVQGNDFRTMNLQGTQHVSNQKYNITFLMQGSLRVFSNSFLLLFVWGFFFFCFLWEPALCNHYFFLLQHVWVQALQLFTEKSFTM